MTCVHQIKIKQKQKLNIALFGANLFIKNNITFKLFTIFIYFLLAE